MNGDTVGLPVIITNSALRPGIRDVTAPVEGAPSAVSSMTSGYRGTMDTAPDGGNTSSPELTMLSERNTPTPIHSLVSGGFRDKPLTTKNDPSVLMPKTLLLI